MKTPINYIMKSLVAFLFLILALTSSGNDANKAHSDLPNTLRYSTDGKKFLTASDDNTVKIWDSNTLKLIRTINVGSPVQYADFCQGDNNKILTYSGNIKIWDFESLNLLFQIEGIPAQFGDGLFGDNGNKLLIKISEEMVILNLTTGGIEWLSPPGTLVNSAQFSHSGNSIITTVNDTAKLLKLEKGNILPSLIIPIRNITRAQFSWNDSLLLTFSDSDIDTLQMWDIATGKLLRSFEYYWDSDETSCTQISRNQQNIFLLNDNFISILNLKTGKRKNSYRKKLNYAEFSADSRYLVTMENYKNSVTVRDIIRNKNIGDIDGFESDLTFVTFSADSKFLITGTESGTIIFWDIEKKKFQAYLYDSINLGKEHDNSLNPELRIPTKHGFLYDAEFSNDGKYAVLGATDGTATIWETATGNCINTLVGHTSVIIQAVFSPDDKLIATAGWDSRIRIWEVLTGKCIRVWLHRHIIISIAFNKDGTLLLSCSKDKTAKIWSLNSEEESLITFSGHTATVNSAVFSSDENRILTASDDSTSRLWDAKTGEQIMLFKGHQDVVNGARFLPGDKEILTFSDDKTVKKWKVDNSEFLYSFSQHTDYILKTDIHPDSNWVVSAEKSRILVWNYASGKIIKELPTLSSGITNIKFSRDGTLIIVCHNYSLEIYNLATGNLLNNLSGHQHQISNFNLSRDGKFFITSSWDQTARIWDLKSKKCIKVLEGISPTVRYAAYNPEGDKIIAVYSDYMARIWDSGNGKCIRAFYAGYYPAKALFSPDGKYLVISCLDNRIKVWDSTGRKLLNTFRGIGDRAGDFNFSKDGKYLLGNFGGLITHIWELKTGKEILRLEGHNDFVNCVEFSPDGNHCATGSNDSSVIIWNTLTGEKEHIFKPYPWISSIAFSNDGNRLYMNRYNNILAWNLKTDTLIKTIYYHRDDVRSIVFNRDGKLFLTASRDKTAKLFDTESGNLLRDFSGSSGALLNAQFSPDEKQILTSSDDCSITIWDALTGLPKFKLYAFDSSDHVAVDEHFRYDGTEKARKKLFYTCGIEQIVLDQIKDLSWEPGLIGKINGINPEPITAKKISEIKICNYSPQVEYLGLKDSIYQFRIKPRNGGLGKVYIYVNEKIVKSMDSSILNCSEGYCNININHSDVESYFISDFENMVTLKATTREGTITSRGAQFINQETKKAKNNPNIYIVSIGISNYKGDGLKLKYASKDAIDFESVVNKSAQKLLNTDGKQHVYSYVFNTEPGSTNWPSKKAIQLRMDSIISYAKADDILLIFFGGHGVLQGGEKKNLYLLTAEASAFDLKGVEAEVAISTEEINQWMQKIKANKQILILDACNSGQMVQNINSMITKRDVPADQQRALESLIDQTGIFILSASATGQSAYETSLYEQGLLTYCLLSGIKLGTGLRDNKFIDVNKWFTNAGNQVKVLASEIGGRQDPQIMGNASFDIGLVDNDISNSIKLSGKKKVFRRSRIIQDNDLLSDDLELSALIDQELNNFSIRGKDSPLTFASDNTSEEAYSIRGRYKLEGNKIIATFFLFKGQKEKVFQFELIGIKGKEKEMVSIIIDKVQLFIKNN